jgi:DNA polymerase-3 subunit beta
MTFTSKLLEGHYPDYHRVIPAVSERNNMKVDRDELKQALSCAAILSNEQFKGVRLGLHRNQLDISTNNPEQEEAQDEMKVDYQGEHMIVGFNVNYLIDVLSALNPGTVAVSLGDTNSSALIQSSSDPNHVYVVMPIRL